ncbi:hypothetical protein FB451DRAFT_1185952 [Mycena latifolia]|nr:hypothetical protein FB451DRAFT_1185952 [Mycena latifolia]
MPNLNNNRKGVDLTGEPGDALELSLQIWMIRFSLSSKRQFEKISFTARGRRKSNPERQPLFGPRELKIDGISLNVGCKMESGLSTVCEEYENMVPAKESSQGYFTQPRIDRGALPRIERGPLASTQKADAHNVLPAALQLDSFMNKFPYASLLHFPSLQAVLLSPAALQAHDPPVLPQRAIGDELGARGMLRASAHEAAMRSPELTAGEMLRLYAERTPSYESDVLEDLLLDEDDLEIASKQLDKDEAGQARCAPAVVDKGCWGECRGAESAGACVEEANGESIPRVLSVKTSKRRDRRAGRGIDRFAVRRWEDNKVQTENERQKLPVDACREDSAKSSWTRAKRRKARSAPTPLRSKLARRPQRRRGEEIETAGSGYGSVLSRGGSLHGLLEQPAAEHDKQLWTPPRMDAGQRDDVRWKGAAKARATDAHGAAVLQALRVMCQLSLSRRRQRHARIVPYPLVLRRGAWLLFFRGVIGVIAHSYFYVRRAAGRSRSARGLGRSTLLDKLLCSTNDGGRRQIATPIRQGPPFFSVEEGKEEMEGCCISAAAICDDTPSSASPGLGGFPTDFGGDRCECGGLSPEELGYQREECRGTFQHSKIRRTHPVVLCCDRGYRRRPECEAASWAIDKTTTPPNSSTRIRAACYCGTEFELEHLLSPDHSNRYTNRGLGAHRLQSYHLRARDLADATAPRIHLDIWEAEVHGSLYARTSRDTDVLDFDAHKFAFAQVRRDALQIHARDAMDAYCTRNARRAPTNLREIQDLPGILDRETSRSHLRSICFRATLILGCGLLTGQNHRQPGYTTPLSSSATHLALPHEPRLTLGLCEKASDACSLISWAISRVSHSRSLSQMSSSRAKHSIFSRKWDVSHNTVASYLPWFLLGTHKPAISCETEDTSAWKVHDFGTRFHGLKSCLYVHQTGSRGHPTLGESAVSTIEAFVVCCYQCSVRQRDSKVPHAAVATSVSPAPTRIVIISEAGRDGRRPDAKSARVGLDADSPIIIYKIGGSETPAQVHLCERLAAAAS